MYYPKNQIETNLYSRDELVFANTTQFYTGFYFKTSDGQYFTGKEPNDGPNNPLTLPPPEVDGGSDTPTGNPSPLQLPVDYRFFDENYNYSILTNQSRNNIPFFPIPYYPVLNKTNINDGYFIRYFCKKANENIYTEIDKALYNFSISSPLYISISLNWIIRGTRNYVFDANQKQILFTERKYKITGLGKFLNDNYLEFHQG